MDNIKKRGNVRLDARVWLMKKPKNGTPGRILTRVLDEAWKGKNVGKVFGPVGGSPSWQRGQSQI